MEKDIVDLKNAKNIQDLATIFDYKEAKTLSYVLYHKDNRYHTFEIPKKSGGTRVIKSPNEKLAHLQKRIQILLTGYIEELESQKSKNKKYTSITHAFRKKHSFITNADAHKGKRYVLNIDLQDFFPSINFGRVRGFLIKDKRFNLHPKVATLLATAICDENQLPQGSPCSPLISNLIAGILDRKLLQLAKQNKCTYTRYADDITFSCNHKDFPLDIATIKESGEVLLSISLIEAITSSGFMVNPKKTRIQHKTSQQTVTGLTVNQYSNIDQNYWRVTKSQCNQLFNYGHYYNDSVNKDAIEDISILKGRLAHIYNVKHRFKKRYLKSVNETNDLYEGAYIKLFKRFLIFDYFINSPKPTIICEGHTDIIYLKCALKSLYQKYPSLVERKIDAKGNISFSYKVRFLRHSSLFAKLMSLTGGSSNIKNFLGNSKKTLDIKNTSKFIEKHRNPLILFLDNDDGLKGGLLNVIDSCVANKPEGDNKTRYGVYRKEDFMYLHSNLYTVITPLTANGEDTCAEDFFDDKTLKMKNNGKKFNKNNTGADTDKEFGKDTFATRIIRPNQNTIDFSRFEPILDRFVKVLSNYKTI